MKNLKISSPKLVPALQEGKGCSSLQGKWFACEVHNFSFALKQEAGVGCWATASGGWMWADRNLLQRLKPHCGAPRLRAKHCPL